MDAYSLSLSDDRLADLVSGAEASGDVDIIREGIVVAAAFAAASDEPFDRAGYRESIGGMKTYPGIPVVDMRREARYW